MKKYPAILPATALSVLMLLAAFIPTSRAVARRADSAKSAEASTVVYVLRHAEKMGRPYKENPPNPALDAVGTERAEALVHVLADAGVTRIFSTDYKRTRDTVVPLAQSLGLEVESYDPSSLKDFARKLRSMSGRVVVVGHSNTTPGLVSFLGGDPGAPIDEKTEFDRLYVLTLQGKEAATTVLLRYGDRP